MAAPIVYDGVNGKYEGTLFNGLKFWVAQRVPTRSSILERIRNNGGKIVQLEKFADVLVADHARKDCPPGSVSWKYINDCVTGGELVDIEDYRIHETKAPSKGIKVPYTKLDEQILVTWVRRAGSDLSGNEIYKDLAKKYPHHSWHSWRDKWVKNMSLLGEDQLPPVLEELPPRRTQPGSGPQTAPDTPAPPAKPTPATRDVKTSSGRNHTPVRKPRNFFTDEDDKILAKYVADRIKAGEKPNGNLIYQDFQKKHPHHGWHSWRDRWVRHLSLRDPSHLSALEEEPAVEPSRAHTHPAISAPSPADPPKARVAPTIPPPSARTPAVPPSSARTPVVPPPSARTPVVPPPATKALTRPSPIERRGNQTMPALIPTNPANTLTDGQPMTRLQELKQRGNQITIARAIQSPARGYLLRTRLRTLQACVAALQPRALGFLTRHALGLTEIQVEPGEEGWFPATEQGPALPQDDDAESAPPEEDEDEPNQPNQHVTPAPPKTTPVLSREEFWRTFNEFNELNCVLPGPWVQIDHQAVDIWDLWRCATAEPDHSFRDWEVIAESLGFDWIAEPHVLVHLKIAFEKHLLEFETTLKEFDQWDEEDEEEAGEGGEEEVEEVEEEEEEEEKEVEEVEEEEEERREGEKGVEEEEDDEEIEEGDEEGVMVEEAEDDETASQESDANFVSSPPINLKRARVLSRTPFSSSVRKRPRYDPDVEVPETPETRTERAGQGVAGARAAASNQHTPTRRPRHTQPARQPAEPEAQYSRPIPQYDGTEDDVLLTPSQQLRSEIEATAFQEEPSRSAPGGTSSAQPLFISDDDETSNSDDGFESVDNLPVRAPPPRDRENPHQRTLPWAKDKGKQPATATPQPPPLARTTPTTATTQPTPRNQPLSTPHPRTPTHTHTPTPPNPPPDPGPILKHFLKLNRYPPTLIARAVRATTCHFHNTEIVLDSLVLGKGVPADMPGVWTEGDDRVLSEVGVGKERDRDKARALKGLVKKHGQEGVVMRRAFLRGLEGA
ncbi:uncharacterized protein B0H64DRAFT_349412 [Chaetomium fimeti]|uniref:DNA-binding protein RAP1 n=1 Tax=Chaetomium fimeti TaxID=1854472 RepID=A0AAE0H7E9_9PEZI|nr:hypothetical protein B0H64DRAFT_349412 [Chaetomium fimeti]